MAIPVGILGATGLVGQRLVSRVAEHPTLDPVAVAASDERIGSRYGDSVTWRIDEALPPAIAELRLDRATPDELTGSPPLVLSAVPGTVAREVEATFAEAGTIVSSNASPRRMAPDVPLVLPEVNAEHVHLIDRQRRHRGWEGAIIKNPNCMAITVSLPLAALDRFGLEHVDIVTMQAISGAGSDGVSAIDTIDNILPDIPGEAEKVSNEPSKVLGSYDGETIDAHPVDIDAACHRVPVLDGHMATCFVELAETPSQSAIEEAITAYPSVDLPSAPPNPLIHRSTPRTPRPRYDRDANDGMSVTVGPITTEGSRVRFTCLAHNTIRGAAGACLLAAETAVDAGYLSERPATHQ